VSFKDIKGQDKAVGFLSNSILRGRIAHAYIFFGPGGVGKKLAALCFAKTLNCEGKPEEAPCDRCGSCKKIDSRNHPDVLLLEPEKEGASVKIERIREIIKDIALKPYEGRKKVYIIDGSETMTHEAQNALLKTLEEPSSESVLILIAQRLKALLPTVISRAQVVKFFPFKEDELKNILKSLYGMDDARAHVLSRLSSGRLGESLKYKDDDFFDRRLRILKALENGSLSDSDYDPGSKGNLKLYLDIMLSWYRDILIAKTGLEDVLELVNIDRKDAIVNTARRMDFERVNDIMNEIVLTTSFLDQNANPKLAMAALELKFIEDSER